MASFDPAHVERGGPPYQYPDGALRVTKLHVGPWENNAYLLHDPQSNEGLLVDAANEADRLLSELLTGIQLVGIVTTHRHPDHVQALRAVLRKHDVWNGAHPADADTIGVGGWGITVLHTPGHTEGSISFKLPSSQVLTGDALFPGGPGRTEGRAAFDQAIASIEQHLFTLPAETRVSPGHGDDTVVGTEAPHLEEWRARGW